LRHLRTAVSILLLLLGTALAVAAVLDTGDEPGVRVLMALCGILLVEAGASKRADLFLPSQRHNHALREEVDALVALVRLLESETVRARTSGSPERWGECNRLHGRLHDSVERVKELVGRADEDRAASGRPAAL